MKKFLAALCAVVMLVTGVFVFGGCSGNGEDMKNAGVVMNVSLNPEVEFILDKDNKVLTANALNEEGNLMLASARFTGKTAEEAVELFVQISAETGFLIEGEISAGENEISVSLSGDETKAKAIFDAVAARVISYLQQLNIQGKIEQGAALSKAYLQSLVAKCEPHIEEAKVQALNYAKTVKTLIESRKETAEFYSQELKNAYYEAKAFAIQRARLEVVKGQLSSIAQGVCELAFQAYESFAQSIEDTRKTLLIYENSPYQKALRAFQEAKVEYLNYRAYLASLSEEEISAGMQELLEVYEKGLETARTALVSAANTASETLSGIKEQVRTAYEAVISAIGNYAQLVKKYADSISKKVSEANEQFYADFETEYRPYLDKAAQEWANMKAALLNTKAE